MKSNWIAGLLITLNSYNLALMASESKVILGEPPLLASVTSVEIEQNGDGSVDLVLQGRHPYLLEGCVRFVDIRVYDRLDYIVKVEPISEIIGGDQCSAEDFSMAFTKKISLSDRLQPGEYLLEVHTLSQKLLHTYVTIE